MIATEMHKPLAMPGGRRPGPPRRPFPMTDDQREYHELLAQLIELNKCRRVHNAGKWHHHSPADYALYEATIQSDNGRQSGKTEFILLNASPGDIIVVPSRHHARHIHDRGAPCDVVTAEEMRLHYTNRSRPLSSIRANTIYIDEATHVFTCIDRRELYFQLARDSAQTFVLLG